MKYINAAGPLVKVELLSDAGTMVQVELSQERYRSLNIKVDDVVFVTPKEMKIFSEDYAI